MSYEMEHALTPEQRRLLRTFVSDYEQARSNAAVVKHQAVAAVQQAEATRDEAYQRLLRAAQLAVGGADVTVDFVTWEVRPREKVAEQTETP